MKDKQMFAIRELCNILSKITDDKFEVVETETFVQIYRNSDKYGQEMRPASAVRRLTELLKTITNAD